MNEKLNEAIKDNCKDIFDKDGNKKKGLGGGNCQISTTLYNALLSTSYSLYLISSLPILLS